MAVVLLALPPAPTLITLPRVVTPLPLIVSVAAVPPALRLLLTLGRLTMPGQSRLFVTVVGLFAATAPLKLTEPTVTLSPLFAVVPVVPPIPVMVKALAAAVGVKVL